jgi:hypothetical protein
VDLSEAGRCGGATLGGRAVSVHGELAAMADGGVVAGSSGRMLRRSRGQ